MDELRQAYALLDEIKDVTDADIIKATALKAFELSNECIEAAIILSKLTENLLDRESILLKAFNATSDEISKERLNLELAYLYNDYGMLKKALELLQSIKNDEIRKQAKYKIMTLLTHFEDETIEEFYKNNADSKDNIDYVRMSFPYMIYKYKKFEFDKAKELFKEIGKLNPYIIKVIMSDVGDDNDEIKEAYKVFKNNAILINESPYIIKFLVDLC